MPITVSFPHHLDGHHGEGLALGGVDLAIRHDGGAGLVLRDEDLPQPTPGAGGQPAHVVGDLHQVGGQGLQGPMGKDQGVLGGEGVEFVGGAVRKGRPVRWATSWAAAVSNPGGALSPVPTAVPPQGQLIEPVQGGSDHVPAVLQHGAPAADLLAEGDGHRILEMGAAGFHHVPVGVLQVLKADQHLLQGGEEPPVEGSSRCDVQGSGEGVVGALGQVHVVVGVEQVLPRLEVAPTGR